MNPTNPQSQIPNPNGTYVPSPDIVAREIEGELIIVPLTAGVGNLEDELYSMNETGREIWRRLDGTRSLAHIAAELAVEFEADPAEIQADVVGLAAELLQRGMLVEA
jgi:hypothetical protein